MAKGQTDRWNPLILGIPCRHQPGCPTGWALGSFTSFPVSRMVSRLFMAALALTLFFTWYAVPFALLPAAQPVEFALVDRHTLLTTPGTGRLRPDGLAGMPGPRHNCRTRLRLAPFKWPHSACCFTRQPAPFIQAAGNAHPPRTVHRNGHLDSGTHVSGMVWATCAGGVHQLVRPCHLTPLDTAYKSSPPRYQLLYMADQGHHLWLLRCSHGSRQTAWH